MSKSLKRGESYNKLPKALAIWIIDYKEKEIKKYKSDLKLCDTKAIERIRKGNNKEEILIKDEIRIIIIDLTKEADKSKIAEWKEIFRSGEVMNKRDKRLQEVVEEIKRSAVKNFYKNNVSKDVICQSLDRKNNKRRIYKRDC